MGTVNKMSKMIIIGAGSCRSTVMSLLKDVDKEIVFISVSDLEDGEVTIDDIKRDVEKNHYESSILTNIAMNKRDTFKFTLKNTFQEELPASVIKDLLKHPFDKFIGKKKRKWKT